MAITLKEVQKYRLTIPAILILAGISIILIIASFTLGQKNTPLSPSPAAIYKSPIAQPIKWSEAKLGLTKDEVVKKFGNPAQTESKDGKDFLIYLDNPQRPNFSHKIILKNNKVVTIFRIIDSEIEDISPSSYANLYGSAEVIRPYVRPEVNALEGYKINDNEYVVVESIPNLNLVSSISVMNKEEYEIYKKDNSKIPGIEGIGSP